MTSQLLVLLNGERAGVLSRADGSMAFRYSDLYVQAHGIPISHAMPLTTEPFGHRVCMAVFGGLLPEDRVRRAVAGMLGISSTNDYRLLEELGGDCAGALEFVADAETPDRCDLPQPVSPPELSRILRELPQKPIPKLDDAASQSHARMSLAGAQDKLPVIQTPDGFALPGSHGVPSTHILKPQPDAFPDLVANEAFCMMLARICELRVADVSHARTLDGQPYLVVRRFDRDQTCIPVRRIHQEDVCQALAIQPDQKYQKEGGPSFAQVADLVRSTSPVPAQDLDRLWSSLVFSVLVGNCDAHGKNYSLLYDTNRPTLAPMYDIVATSVYDELTTTLAMRVGEARQLDDVDLAAWHDCAKAAGYAPAYALKRVRELAHRAVALSDPVRSGLRAGTSTEQPVLDAIIAGIRSRAQRWGA